MARTDDITSFWDAVDSLDQLPRRAARAEEPGTAPRQQFRLGARSAHGYDAVMIPDLNISALSAADRLRLIEQLWESLSENSAQVPVTEAQKAELERRLDDIDAGTVDGIPWDELRRQIRARHK